MAKIEKIAIIAYGDGGELGDFKVFADSLKKTPSKKYTKVLVQYVNRDTDFFKLIESVNHAKEKVAELHVFSHSIGAGIFLGYKDDSISRDRGRLIARKNKIDKKVTYNEAVATEIGAIQTDDFKVGAFVTKRSDYQKKFSSDAFIKIWGCNSGVSRWVYSDGGLIDPKDTSEVYYWRAFNERNTPKPSIAEAMAVFFNRKVYGASSGSSIEVYHKKRWKSSQKYKKQIGHWPSGRLPHRLVPDIGDYNEYLP
ncbi:hypothetical protein MNBD_GAMMA08-2958 [hydrothermal vent metagenome]|uniref:DUF676 domain-containing protein n=1 Tax=hydrothermal vent metagenome TaxID=652676 RepID=A0A3B0XH72_9ZZZZ